MIKTILLLTLVLREKTRNWSTRW